MGVDDLTTEGLDYDSSTATDSTQVSANGSLSMPWNRTAAETASDNDVLNTILRSMIKPIGNTHSM